MRIADDAQAQSLCGGGEARGHPSRAASAARQGTEARQEEQGMLLAEMMRGRWLTVLQLMQLVSYIRSIHYTILYLQ